MLLIMDYYHVLLVIFHFYNIYNHPTFNEKSGHNKNSPKLNPQLSGTSIPVKNFKASKIFSILSLKASVIHPVICLLYIK